VSAGRPDVYEDTPAASNTFVDRSGRELERQLREREIRGDPDSAAAGSILVDLV
jgi:hypothetical protein